MSRTKFVLPAAVVLLALAASTAAYGTYTGGGPSPDPFVVGGGQFFGSQLGGAQRDFSLDSHVDKKGLKVYGVLRYGRNTAALEGPARNVSCVSVQGNMAVAGGTRPGSTAGWVMFFIDNGAPGGAMDQATLVQEFDLSDSAWPVGFPNVCPSPTQAASYGLVYESLVGGDIIVSGGSS